MTTFVIIAGVASLSLVYAALTRPKTVLYIAVFLVPWRGIDPYFFLGISLSRIFIAVVGMATVAQFATKKGAVRVPISKGLLLFIVYSIALSAARIPFLPNVAVAGGPLRAPTTRAELQIVYFLVVLVTPLIAYPAHLKTGEDCSKLVKVFLASLITLAGLGWMQLAVWYGTGFNLFPIGLVPSFFGDFQTANAGFVMAGLDLHRMCSLGGEPKDLGQALTVGLLIIQALLASPALKDKAKLRWCWLFLFFSIALTYSTSSLFLWMIGSAVEIAVLILKPGIAGSLGEVLRNANVLLLIIAGVAMTFITYSGISTRSVRRIAAGRSVDRVELEEFDDAALGFLKQNPDWAIFGTGLGNVHLYANDFLSPEAATYASGTVFRPKTGVLAMTGEIGLVGVLLWLLAVLGQATRLLAAKRRLEWRGYHPLLAGYVGVFTVVLVTLTSSYFAVSSIEEYIFAALALSIAATSYLEGMAVSRSLNVNPFRVTPTSGSHPVVHVVRRVYPARLDSR